MEYVLGVKSTNDNASKFLVSTNNSVGIGDLVSFETSDNQEIARVEHACLLADDELELLNYISEKVYPVIDHWLLSRAGVKNAGAP